MTTFPHKNKIISLAEEFLKRHKSGARAVGWFDGADFQARRFRELASLFKYLPRRKKLELLDLGCGRGDFYAFLKKRGWLSRYGIVYTGYDLSPRMIASCRRRFPGIEFQLRDILTEAENASFDVVLTSGIFNLKLANGRKEHRRWVVKILRKMGGMSRLGILANFQGWLGRRGKDRREYIYDPDEVKKICRQLAPDFKLERFIFSYDYSVLLRKKMPRRV